MVVNSYNQEFGYELLSAVPYAYEQYLKGQLTETISGVGSEPLYYFSPKHTINNNKRNWANTLLARKHRGLPYTNIHEPERPALKFPPYKEQFKNNIYKWDKPTICICNRYNNEWGQPPVNYFDPQTLEWLFENLKKDYEIVYIAVDLPAELEDNNHSMSIPDRGIAQRHGIKIFQEIKGECWNTSLLQVFANCNHYITMNGGYSILASLFEGTNIIYSTKRGVHGCKELVTKSFSRWYPNHNDQRTVFVDNYEALKAKVQAIYVDKLPTANVILRTSNRPEAFKVCLKSIEVQTYPNINTIVTTDDIFSCGYTRGYDVRHLDMSKIEVSKEPKNSKEYGIPFKSNRYIHEAQNRIKDGFIIILDDDDMFTSKNSVSTIMEHAEDDKLLIWRAGFGERLIPSDNSFGKEVIVCDLPSNAICYHVKHKDLTNWSEWKRADYRTAKKLSENMPIKWVDSMIARIQHKPGNGKRVDVIYNKLSYMRTVRVLNATIGQVGKLKRLPRPIAEEMVAKGYAEYMSDVIDGLNNKVEVIGKPIVTENKELVTELENKSDGTKADSNGGGSVEPRGSETLSEGKPVKPNGRRTNSGANKRGKK